MATQTALMKLPKNAERVDRYRACMACDAPSVGVLKSDRSEPLGPVCGPCGRLAIAQRGR